MLYFDHQPFQSLIVSEFLSISFKVKLQQTITLLFTLSRDVRLCFRNFTLLFSSLGGSTDTDIMSSFVDASCVDRDRIVAEDRLVAQLLESRIEQKRGSRYGFKSWRLAVVAL